MSDKTSYSVYLRGLNCAVCAGKIENAVERLEGIYETNFNMANEKFLIIKSAKIDNNSLNNRIQDIVDSIEEGVTVEGTVEKRFSTLDDSEEEIVHSHLDEEGLSKMGVFTTIFSILALVTIHFISLDKNIKLFLYLSLYLLVAKDILIIAVKNIIRGDYFDENFLMSIASIGAIIVGEYPEAISIMIFYQVGEHLQDMAVNKSRRSIGSLLELKPDYANILLNGEINRVNPEKVKVGDIILVRQGEKVPLDGVIVKGETFFDTSNITGESVPKRGVLADKVVAGFINTQGVIEVEVKREYSEGTIAKIIEMVENSALRKAKIEKFITRFSKVYTPIVVLMAFLIGIVYPLLFNADFSAWFYRACVFLVISCPCALVISVPLGIFGGIGAASAKGIFVKGGNYLEGVDSIETIVFDKTGTITKGVFKVSDIITFKEYSKDTILKLAAYGEYYSTHPIGRAIKESYNEDIDLNNINNYLEISGRGITYSFNTDNILLGNSDLFKEKDIVLHEVPSQFTQVHVAKNNIHIGTIILADELKDNVINNISSLKSRGIKTVILSGDNSKIVDEITREAGIDLGYGELLPIEKVEKLEEIKANSNGLVAFVGDGVNDAPVLARSDIGIAMGRVGADSAVEAADIVLMNDDIGKLSELLVISKFTKKIVSQNIAMALIIKLVVLLLGVMGLATMWQAVFSDVGVALLAVFNSMRVLKLGN